MRGGARLCLSRDSIRRMGKRCGPPGGLSLRQSDRRSQTEGPHGTRHPGPRVALRAGRVSLADRDDLGGGGSHIQGRLEHETTADASNVLYLGQTVDGVPENQAVMCTHAPGEASFPHGWTLHASMPNRSDDRRIGINMQFIALHMRQTKHDLDSAICLRGQDRFHHFGADMPASRDLDPDALVKQAELERIYIETAATS